MTNYLCLAAACCISLAGCSSSSSSDDADGTTESESGAVDNVLIGVFLDSAVEGISYATASQTGVTNGSGEFQFLSGESVTFSIGDLSFPAATAKETVTPLDMAESADIYDNLIVNTIVLLQTLDVDASPDNGITISDQAAANAMAVDLTMNPSDFSQAPAVINLVSNSGSSNTSLISVDDALQHFQSTLVGTGLLEEFSRLDYTNFLIGNTADFSAGSKIYYREDGAKFVLRLSGDRFEGTWWLDDNGLICEDIPSSQTTYCVADAQNFMFNKSPDSTNFYNYSETGFVSGLTITEGDSLELSGS